LAGAAALAYRLPQAETPNEDPEAVMRAKFDKLRQGFLRRYSRIAAEAGLGVLSPAPVHRDIKERFLEMVETYGVQTVTLGYHGTAECNLPSVFRRGLVAGRKGSDVPVANGSQLGLGIYLAEEGAHTLSQGFLKGSSKMLLCGVVDTTTVRLAEKPQQDKSEEVPKARALRRGGVLAHRQHRRPAVSAAVAFQRWQAPRPGVSQKPQFLGRHQLDAENEHLRHVGTAMVVSKEALVAPLFVADSMGAMEVASEDHSGIDLRPPGNHVERPVFVGTRRCWDGDAEVAERDRHAIRVKRRLTRKKRDVGRSALYAEKWHAL